ncbi:M23 family metallopeptidase [bacterium SCSIO 12741]|nr:M23 family metallopeptidase [bacterium SCSIO 12741]
MKKRYKAGLVFLAVLLIGYLIPQNLSMPVEGATKSDYHKDSFWYYPWGKSVTHKGVDIFASEGTVLNSSTSGIVLYTGKIKMGGNVVLILGPKWRLHYYAHLKDIQTRKWGLVKNGETIGSVGSSGNAKGKPAHLHYSIVTPVPYIWRWDGDRQGWKKMFYLNPIDFLNP